MSDGQCVADRWPAAHSRSLPLADDPPPECSTERAALENKYAAKYAEQYENRRAVVAGEVDVTATDAEGNVVELENPAEVAEGVPPAVLGGEGPAPTGIPNFWLQVRL